PIAVATHFCCFLTTFLIPLCSFSLFFLTPRRPPCSTLFPYTTLFRSARLYSEKLQKARTYLSASHRNPSARCSASSLRLILLPLDRKSTRLNSSHVSISYAVFCLKKKKTSTDLCTDTSLSRATHRRPT